MQPLFSYVCAVLLLTFAAACGPPPLANTHLSPDSLARGVLDAMAARDDRALRALAVNEQEFRANVWPSLPAARPERNLPFSYVWGDLRQKSETSLVGSLASHGGRRYELIDVAFGKPAAKYAAFRIHPEALFTVRDSAGASQELRLCGSFIEQGGAWKVFSYVTED
jgi:hypothetical protein